MFLNRQENLWRDSRHRGIFQVSKSRSVRFVLSESTRLYWQILDLEKHIKLWHLHISMSEASDGLEDHQDGLPPEANGEEDPEIKYHETVVKTSLQSFLRNKRLLEEIRKRVDTFSKRLNLASVALSGILKECFEGYGDVLHAQLPEVFNQTFICQLMVGTHKARIDDHWMITDYYSRYPSFLRDIRRYKGDNQIYVRGSKTYITNLKNSLKMNFESRLKTYTQRFKDIHGLSENERKVMYSKIVGSAIKSPILKKTDISKNPIIGKEIEEQRRILGLKECRKLGKKSFDSETLLLRILRQWVAFNRFYEHHDFKLFSLTPISSIRHHFIGLDVRSLGGIYTSLEMKVPDPSDNPDAFWNTGFKLYALKDIMKCHSNGKTFSGLIETDGITICTHFKKEIVPSPNEQEKPTQEIVLVESDKVIVLGLDPGRVNIYTVVEKLSDGTVKSYTLTRSQYYQWSGIRDAIYNTDLWKRNVQKTLDRLSTVSIKGVNLTRHLDYLKMYIETYQTLWNEYTKPRWARQRFRLYGGKKRAFAKFFNQITQGREDKTFVVAYGSAKFAPCSKNEIAVPTTRAYRECVARFFTKPVDEHLTSKVDNETKTVLQGVCTKRHLEQHKKNPKKRLTFLRGLYWCGSTIADSKYQQGKFVNRDVNAALNIRECGMLASANRPLALRRRDDQQKTLIIFGKAIRC